MPRVPRFQTAAISDLCRQLRYAPRETKCREMDSAEQLASEIDPRLNYPEDFVVFRVTGYRSDRNSEPVTLVGEAVLPDLVNLVQHLSYSVDLPMEYRDRQPMSLEEVQQELNVAPKTLQRYRRQGLVCHYVCGPDGTKRLVCFRDALERFVNAHRRKVERASAFSRVDDDVQQRIIEDARALRAAEHLSLNQVAQHLAPELRRSHETVRAVLRRHDRRAPHPIFAENGPLSARDRAIVYRAWSIGVRIAVLTRRFAKTTPTIHRAVNRVRAERLAAIELSWVELPTFERPDAEPVILSAPAVVVGLSDPFGDDLLELLQRLRGASALDEDLEDALVAAFNLLKRRAARLIRQLPAHPGAGLLDDIETDLRWAARLKRRLVALALPVAVRTIELNLRRRLQDEPREVIRRLVDLALNIISTAAESVDPARGRRLERMAGFAMDRALATGAGLRPVGRAAARHHAGSMRLCEEARRVCPWQAWLDLRQDLVPHLDALPTPARHLVCRHYGLGDEPPESADRLSKRLGRPRSAISATLRESIRQLRQAARAVQLHS